MTQTLRKLIAKVLLVPALSIGASGLIAISASAADCSIDSTNPTEAGSQCTKNDSQPENIAGEDGVLKTVTNVLLFIIGAVSVIMIIYGGIMYTTSGGNSDRVTKAKNTILYSVVGLIVAILAFAVTNFVIGAFSNK